jgi:hypothetical protein
MTRVNQATTFFATALVLVTVCASGLLAQDAHSHATADQQQKMTLEDQSNADTLIKVVRQATERFSDVRVAEAEGYKLQFGCVSGGDSGAMGLHYVNGDLVNLVIADAWNAKHSDTPQLMGQLFHLFESPNRFGLPAFYTLHVWAWKHNPYGAYVNWHPNVSCQSFSQK